MDLYVVESELKARAAYIAESVQSLIEIGNSYNRVLDEVSTVGYSSENMRAKSVERISKVQTLLISLGEAAKELDNTCALYIESLQEIDVAV